MEDQSTSYNYTLIIPHYNIPKLLRRCLRTVPKRDDLQVIVVDDCSTNELEELEKVKQEYDWVEWYDTGTNGGGGKARNIGLNHAKGKYLIFADADDFFNLCFNDALDKYKDSNFDIIYFAISTVDSRTLQNTRTNEFYINALKNFKNNKEQARFYYTVPWAKMISHHLVESMNIRFHETIISNDVFFSTQVDFYAMKIVIDEVAIYNWTYRLLSTSRNLTPERALIRLHEDNLRRELIFKLGLKDAHQEYLPMILDVIFSSKNKAIIEKAILDCRIIKEDKYSLKWVLLKYRIRKAIRLGLAVSLSCFRRICKV